MATPKPRWSGATFALDILETRKVRTVRVREPVPAELARERPELGGQFRCATDCARALAPLVARCAVEELWVCLLDGRHKLTALARVGIGTATCSLVHPREVYGPAIRHGAVAIVLAHNHPSGDPTPSAEDVEVTRRMADAGALLGIPLLDHVVLGAGAHTSVRETHPHCFPRNPERN